MAAQAGAQPACMKTVYRCFLVGDVREALWPFLVAVFVSLFIIQFN